MMYFLGAAELARMRADVAKMMPGTAIIQALTTASDGAGGVTETWAAVTGGTVACRMDPLNVGTQIETAGMAEAVRTEFQLTLPYDAPISAFNRVSVGGVVYEVRQLDAVHSWNVSKRLRVAVVS